MALQGHIAFLLCSYALQKENISLCIYAVLIRNQANKVYYIRYLDIFTDLKSIWILILRIVYTSSLEAVQYLMTCY